MDERVLIADKGYYYTNGEIYGKWISLGDGVSPDEFYQITDDEYKAIDAEKRKGDLI